MYDIEAHHFDENHFGRPAAALVTSLPGCHAASCSPVPHGPPATRDPPIRTGAAGGVTTNSSKGINFPLCFSAGRPLHSLCAGWLSRRLLIARSEGAPRFAVPPFGSGGRRRANQLVSSLPS